MMHGVTSKQHRTAQLGCSLAALALAVGMAGCSSPSSSDGPRPPAGSAHRSTAGTPSSSPRSSTPAAGNGRSHYEPANPTASGPQMDDNGTPAPSVTGYPTADSRKPLTTPGKKGKPRGLKITTTKLDRRDADDVAAAFGVLVATSDTKIDKSGNDAGRRAAALTTDTLAGELRRAGSAIGPDAAWTVLAQHHGYTTVRSQLGGLGPHPTDTATTGQRAVTITVQRHGDRHWVPAPDDPQTLLITLHRDGARADWEVQKFEYLS